jgi:hypothetical protein
MVGCQPAAMTSREQNGTSQKAPLDKLDFPCHLLFSHECKRHVAIGSFHALGKQRFALPTLVLFLLDLRGVRFQKLSPIVRHPCQTRKHFKKQKQLKATLETEPNVHLPANSDQGSALPKVVEWVLGQTKEARLQALVVFLWKQIVGSSMKKIQNSLQRLAVGEVH